VASSQTETDARDLLNDSRIVEKPDETKWGHCSRKVDYRKCKEIRQSKNNIFEQEPG